MKLGKWGGKEKTTRKCTFSPLPHHPIRLSLFPLLYLWIREHKDIGEEVINYSPQGSKSGYCNHCQNGCEGKILNEIRFLVVFTLHKSVSKTSQ